MTMQESGRRADRGGRKRHRISVIGVIGELLITAGVLVFLFLGWQLWLNDLIEGDRANHTSVALAQTWNGDVTHKPAVAKDYGEPVVGTAAATDADFAVMYVPRFGDGYAITVAEGVSTGAVLDKTKIGHYPGTALPGQVGNFAVAAHRTTHGAPFHWIANLRIGDKIYVQTKDGYYTYDFRGLEYVRPTGVGVLDAVPQAPAATPTDRVMTMTSCNPMFSASERIIAYSVLESWQPLSAGPPAAIAATVTTKAG